MSGGGGGGTTTTKSVAEPAKEFKPYLTAALGQSSAPPATLTGLYGQDPSSRIIGFSDPTLQAIGGVQNTVGSGLGYLDEARQQSRFAGQTGVDAVSSTPVFGDMAAAYIDPTTGQAVSGVATPDIAALGVYGDQSAAAQMAMASALPTVISGVNEAAGGAGRVGSGLYADALGRGIAEAVAPYAFESAESALTRGASLYDSAANRQQAAAQTAFGLANDQFGQGADLIQQNAAAAQGLNDASLGLYASLASVGGTIEDLESAYANAEYDNFDQYIERLALLSGLGGGTTSSSSSGGGGSGLGQALGGAMLGSALLSGLG